MVRLYLYENVHGAIVKGLQQRGIDVLTVQEDQRRGAPDPQVLQRSGELGRVLFSQDKDMLILASERWMLGQTFCGVIYAEQRNTVIRRCVDDLELIACVGDPEEFRDRVTYLPF